MESENQYQKVRGSHVFLRDKRPRLTFFSGTIISAHCSVNIDSDLWIYSMDISVQYEYQITQSSPNENNHGCVIEHVENSNSQVCNYT